MKSNAPTELSITQHQQLMPLGPFSLVVAHSLYFSYFFLGGVSSWRSVSNKF